MSFPAAAVCALLGPSHVFTLFGTIGRILKWGPNIKAREDQPFLFSTLTTAFKLTFGHMELSHIYCALLWQVLCWHLETSPPQKVPSFIIWVSTVAVPSKIGIEYPSVHGHVHGVGLFKGNSQHRSPTQCSSSILVLCEILLSQDMALGWSCHSAGDCDEAGIGRKFHGAWKQ